MVIRRFVIALRQQDWTTVSIEFLIVVAGIFVGLQVDGWNEVRKDRLLEVEYLQRIDAELMLDIDAYDNGVSVANTRLTDAALIMESLANPSVATSQPTAFVRALVRAGFTYSPLVNGHTFEEMKSAGELGIIRDVSLRTSITRHYQSVSETAQWSYLREMTQTEYLKRQAGILRADQFHAFWTDRSGKEVTAEEAAEAYAKLSDRHDLIDWMPVTIAGLNQSKKANELAKESAERLRDKIARTMGATQ